jgi:phage-related protein
MPDQTRPYKRQWRQYKTAAGHSPVADFLAWQSEYDVARITAAMRKVAREGLRSAMVRDLKGPIREVRVTGHDAIFRILFAPQGRYEQVFLALEGFSKKEEKTPTDTIRTAETRLRDWNRRGLLRKLLGR